MVFTDGSVKNRDSEGMPQTLGYGACASILIPVEIGRDVIPNNKHVGLITNNVECEVAGIELALNQIVQYIKDISINCYNKEIFIFCDCTSAIDIVCNQSDISSRVTELRNIWTNLSVLREKGITTEIIWCPGHCDIPYNDLADKEAKRSAENLSQLRSYEDSIKQLNCTTVNRLIRNEQSKAWQLSWQRSTTGRTTREMIPKVKTRLKWSNVRSVDMSYARILLGSTNLNSDMYQMKLAESPNCICELDRETVDHFLLQCEIYKDQRDQMKKDIADIWFEKRTIGSLNLSKEMLAGPRFSTKLNSTDDDKVKSSLFRFLYETKGI